MADLAERDDRPGPDRLGAVHVVVDDVGADLGQVRREGADRDRVVGLVDDEDGERRPAAACARRCPATATRPTRRSASGPSGVTRPYRCSWAPPFVPVARTWTTRIRRPPASGRALDGVEAGIERRGGAHHQSLRRTSSALDGLVDRAPLVLVRLVAAQEVDPAQARARGRARRRRRPSGRPATGRARRGRRRRCSRGRRRRSRSGCRPRSAGRRPTGSVRRSGPSGPNSSNSRRKKTRLWAPPGVSGNRPSSPQRFWWRSMNASRSASGSVDVVQRDLADGLGAADLAPDLVALLLAERREVVVDVGAVGQGHDRADVLALDVERPALGRSRARRTPSASASAVGSPQRSRRRSTTSHGAGVGAGQVGGERLGDGRQVRGRGEDRRVVGVVRGPEEDGLGGRRDRRQRQVVRRGASSCAVSASVGSTSWRCISGTIATDRAGRRRVTTQRLLVGVRAVGVPPGPVEGPRRERASPTGCGRERVPGLARDVVEAPSRRRGERSGRGRWAVRRGRPRRPRDRRAPRRAWGRSRPEDSTGSRNLVATATARDAADQPPRSR